MAFSFHIDDQQMLLATRRKGPTVVTTWSIWSPFTIQNGKNPFPYTPCMVYLPTFSWFLWYMLDEYTIHGSYGFDSFFKILETKSKFHGFFKMTFFLQEFAKLPMSSIGFSEVATNRRIHQKHSIHSSGSHFTVLGNSMITSWSRKGRSEIPKSEIKGFYETLLQAYGFPTRTQQKHLM